jgi:heme/copper-type cytochrome/quinol oxidase subunit 4
MSQSIATAEVVSLLLWPSNVLTYVKYSRVGNTVCLAVILLFAVCIFKNQILLYIHLHTDDRELLNTCSVLYMRTSTAQVHTVVFWARTRCNLVRGYQYFKGTHCLHRQGRTEVGSCSKIVDTNVLQVHNASIFRVQMKTDHIVWQMGTVSDKHTDSIFMVKWRWAVEMGTNDSEEILRPCSE